VWGSLLSCGRLSIGQLPVLRRHCGDKQSPRKLPAWIADLIEVFTSSYASRPAKSQALRPH
jgi:hypothetical protein